jgi:hypothetical protein
MCILDGGSDIPIPVKTADDLKRSDRWMMAGGKRRFGDPGKGKGGR